jgi:hypothetical protein
MALVNENFTAFDGQIEDLQLRHRSNMISRKEIRHQILILKLGIQRRVSRRVVQSPFSSDTANIF